MSNAPRITKEQIKAEVDNVREEYLGVLYRVVLALEEPTNGSAPEGIDIAAEIDRVYDEMRDLVETSAGEPDLPRRLEALQIRLEKLEELEADVMERHYRSQLEFDPAAGERLLARVGRLLGTP